MVTEAVLDEGIDEQPNIVSADIVSVRREYRSGRRSGSAADP